MKDLIAVEMGIDYDKREYISELELELCSINRETQPDSMISKVCYADILADPIIEVIPTTQVSRYIICTTPSCTISLEETVTVSTTHSAEIGVSVEVSAKPFGVGVAFTTSLGYSFSHTSEASTALNYGFALEHGDTGYIGMVNAQITSQVRFKSCTCYDQACVNRCKNGDFQNDETFYHQKIIMKNGTPRGFVAFVYTN